MAKYRVLDQDLITVSRGDFCARVKDGMIELPEPLAWDLIAIGWIVPCTDEDREITDDGLRQLERRQGRPRKQ